MGGGAVRPLCVACACVAGHPLLRDRPGQPHAGLALSGARRAPH